MSVQIVESVPRYVILTRFFDVKGIDVDVPISQMYCLLKGCAHQDVAHRQAQAYVGARVAYANKKMKNRGLRVVPGKLKRTYRMVVVPSE